MSGRERGAGPPRLAERLLAALVGPGPTGRSILGDAREEFATRRRYRSRLASTAWYWGYVVSFALTYRGGGGAGGPLGLSGAFRHAGRSLTRRPWLSLAVVATLALGLGVTTLAYALIDGILIRPLPYPDPGALVHVSRVDPTWFGGAPTAQQAGNVKATPAATYFDWERRARSFSRLGAFAPTMAALQGEGDPVRVLGAGATSGVFGALEVPAAVGRHLLAEDDALGAAPVVVLSHGLWMRRFGGSRDVLGSTVRLDGTVTTVVGVMPETFAFPTQGVDFWANFDDDTRRNPRRNAGFLHAVGRLAPGTSVEQARAELARIGAELAAEERDEEGFQTVVFPLSRVTVAGVRSGLLLLLGAAVVVLLVGCANVTNLFLARVAERRREFAVHAALGAGSRRLAGLVLGESLLLTGLGGACGFALARAGLGPFLAALPMSIPRANEIHVDGRVFAVAVLLSVCAAVLMAVVPAVRTGRTELNSTLRDGGHGATGGRRSGRGNGALISAEVALAVLLMSTSGLFLASYRLSTNRPRGFEMEDVLTVTLSVPSLYAATGEERRVFFEELLERARAVPGVAGVALASQMPLMGSFSSPPASIETDEGVEEAILHTSIVTPAYLDALDIPLLAGRGFGPDDVEGSASVILVSRTLADRFWPGQDPLGRRIRLDSGEDAPWREVVGVVGAVRYGFAGSEVAEYYRPFSQDPSPYVNLVVKTTPGAGDVQARVGGVLRDLLPSVPFSLMPLVDRAARDADYRWSRVATAILLGLAGAAILLAVLGIYSVLAYAVVRRTRDIGIRKALGGAPAGIVRHVVVQGLRMAALGVAVGVVLSVAAGSLTRSALVGVAPSGPWILVGVVGVVLVTSVAASLVPAWRAVRVDPLVAFRAE